MKYAFYIMALLVASSCAANFDADAQSVGGTDGIDPQIKPQDALLNHDVMEANRDFDQTYSTDPSNTTALAGKAITDILLLPYSESVSKVLTENLGATSRLGRDGDDVIYGDQGLLYFAARGTPWNPEPGGLSGTRSILADRLPWDEASLTDPIEFVAGLDRPVDLLTSNLVGVADALGEISRDLTTVIDSEQFGSFFLPGEVFHNGNIAIRFSKVELSVLQGAVEAVRTGIYFVSAYEHAWTLAAAFGPTWDEIANDPNHEQYVPGFDYEDYSTTYLNQFFGRSIRDPGRLTKAGESFVASIAGFQNALGLAQTDDSPYLDFNNADASALSDLNDLLDAVKMSVNGSVTLPNTTPDTQLDLSIVFTDGRTISPENDLLERVTDDSGSYWEVSNAASEELTTGILTPDDDFEYTAAESISDAIEAIFQGASNDVSDTFL